MHIAAENGLMNILKILLDSQADINAQTKSLDTPLLYAINSGHIEVALYLIQRDGRVDINNQHGDLPIHVTAERGHIKVLEKLYEFNPEHIDLKSMSGFTPLVF